MNLNGQEYIVFSIRNTEFETSNPAFRILINIVKIYPSCAEVLSKVRVFMKGTTRSEASEKARLPDEEILIYRDDDWESVYTVP